MIDSLDRKLCTGCGACKVSCPKTCIELKPDEDGFLYPEINSEKCICCNACEAACPVMNPPIPKKAADTYAAFAKDDFVRLQSSSGGLFTVLASEVISRGGVVFGAVFNEHNKVVHGFTETADGIARMRGSKYVQSYTADSFKAAKSFLDSGRIVYFSGTPCQISGLVSYLKKDYDHLYTQDVICHGAPSPLVFEKYLQFRNHDNAELSSISFRNKDNGWKNYNFALDFSNGEKYRASLNDDIYLKQFLSDITLRESCYNCSFKSPNRTADITLADFWGIGNIMPEMDDNRGTSLVILNSDKGKDLFSRISNDIIYKVSDAAAAIKYNPAAEKSVAHNPLRNNFFEDFNSMNFLQLDRKYSYVNPLSRLISAAKHVVKKITHR